MSDQTDAINNVLGDYTPLDNGHPMAQATLHAVAALKASEAEEFDAITVEVLPGLIIRPNDVLVISVSHNINAEHADRIKAEVFRRLPGIADVVVLSGAHITGVYREEATP